MTQATMWRPTRALAAPTLTLLAGLAAGLSTAPKAEAISLVKLRTDYSAWQAVQMPVRDEMDNIIDTEVRAVTGQGVTIGMIEAAQPNLDHIAFDGLDYRRIWYPFEGRTGVQPVSTVRRDIAPLNQDGSALRFPIDLHRHATATAGAMVARNTSLFGTIDTFGPLTGIAPDANLLAGALATDVDVTDGSLQGITPETMLFTLAAMTDIDFNGDGAGDFIGPLAAWYGVPAWEPASVINISFGAIRSANNRAGEDEFSRLCNIIVTRTGTTIVAGVGDFARLPFLDTLEEDEGSIAAPASAFNVIAVGRTDSGQNIEERHPDSGIGPIPFFDWIVREGNEYLQDTRAADGGAILEDYPDINFLDGEDPRDGMQVVLPDDVGQGGGQRVGIDLVAPGTFINLPSNPINGSQFLSNVDVWDGWEGTSFASGIVTGAIALMQEYGREWGLSTDPLVMKAVLLNSCEKGNGWNNMSAGDQQNEEVGEITRIALDPEVGAGFLNFERLLVQYRASGDGYADLTPANTSILATFRPVFRRDPNITKPSDGEPGPDYTPVIGALSRASGYFEKDPNNVNLNRVYLYTSTDFATVTGFSDPTAQSGVGVRQPGEQTGGTSTGVSRSAAPHTPAENTPAEELRGEGSWQNLSAQPISSDRFENSFPGSGNNRYGNNFPSGGNTNGNTGAGATGFGSGPRPGNGGGASGGDSNNNGGGGGFSVVQPCATFGQTRCIRAGWDVGRIGVGFLDLPIGLLPEMTDITVTLTWNRDEDVADSLFEELLNGVITAPPPGPGPVTQPDEPAGSLDPGVLMGPDQAPVFDRTVKHWKSDRANRTIVPLVMAGTTMRGPAPDFTNIDIDGDGADDMALLDTCFIDASVVALGPDGLPLDAMQDSYDPLQIDMDMDGCGPPCDPDDADALNPPDDLAGVCLVDGISGGATTFFDSERLRRVSNMYFTTATDTMNLDPVALSGVVALRFPTAEGFGFATGVLLDGQRILTAAHPFDTDNDGFSNITPGTVSILFPTFRRGAQTVQYSGGSVNRIQIHPSFNYTGDRNLNPGNPPTLNGRDDLAIITVSGDTFSEFVDALPGGFVPYDGSTLQFYAPLVATPPAIGTQEIVFAGFGESGDGRFGVPANLAAGDPPIGFTPISLTQSGQPTPNLRVGKNVIDFYPPAIIADDDDEGNDTALTELFIFDFDDPDSPSVGGLGGGSLGNRVESMITFGDSGSPSFIHNDINTNGAIDPGELQLFGINTAADMAANQSTLSTYGSQGMGMVLNAYKGTDSEGNFRFIDAVLNEIPPQQPGSVNFGGDNRPGQPDKLVAFRGDNLDLELRRSNFNGGNDAIVAQSQSGTNVEHIFVEDIEEFGAYYIRITWAGPIFDWGGFRASGAIPFRIVQPIDETLTDDDIVDFFPAEDKYGLAWWADIPFDRIFEIGTAGRSAQSFMGDMNGDLAIDSLDIAELLNTWGTSGPVGDLTKDGTVDAADLMILIQNYGR